MKTEYRIVDTTTSKGVAEAERLKNSGWEIFSSGLFQIQFYRNEETKSKYAFDPEILKGLRKIV